MGGIFIRNRTIRLGFVALILGVFCCNLYWNNFLMKSIAAAKISEFTGGRFIVTVGEVKSGIWGDTVLQDVAFYGRGQKSTIFRLDRVEISYSLLQAILEKAGLMPRDSRPLREAGIYFSEKNPFIRGYIKMYSSDKVLEVFGNISPVVFGDEQGRAVKGTLKKQPDGRYDCYFLWEGASELKGILDPDNRTVEFGVFPAAGKDKVLKIEGAIAPGGEVKLYSRFYKWRIDGTEFVGDIWLSFTDKGIPEFSAEAKNLLINKRPIWDISVNGRFNRTRGNIHIEQLKWGENIGLVGVISTREFFPARLNLAMKRLDLAELSKILGSKEGELAGISTAEIEFQGPLKTASVSGRIFIEKGIMGEMEFISMFATLGGKLPVVTISDARVVKDGGNIIVSGEVDFSKMGGDDVLEHLKFETDNKVAVWERWQISKEEGSNKVEARKNRMVVCTSFEGDDPQNAGDSDPYKERDVWFKYKLDNENSLRMEVSEEGDFWGLEHKVQF